MPRERDPRHMFLKRLDLGNAWRQIFTCQSCLCQDGSQGWLYQGFPWDPSRPQQKANMTSVSPLPQQFYCGLLSIQGAM